MSKRSWSDANHPRTPGLSATTGPRILSGAASPDRAAVDYAGASEGSNMAIPQISRKVKACTACRKQKIKCIMDDGPPCRRCSERGLGCVLNKSLQTIIDEKSHFTQAFAQDLETVYGGVQDILKKLHMEPLPSMRSNNEGTSALTMESSCPSVPKDGEHSRDSSPSLDGGISSLPIQSLYSLTRLSALRSPGLGDGDMDLDADASSDFISRGAISYEDAERLFGIFKEKLDFHMYGTGCPYRSLDEMRRRSSVLTACVCAVAALHDAVPQSEMAYTACSHEFRRLISGSVFEKNASRDLVRALCMAGHWLPEISWAASGMAGRRGAELKLNTYYHAAVTTGDEEAMDGLRLWYMTYVCDQHLSLGYGRVPAMPEDDIVRGCEGLLHSPASTEADKRLVSKIALLMILSKVRQLFGTDTGNQVPQEYNGQIKALDYEIDSWCSYWSSMIPDHGHNTGQQSLPRLGITIQLHFAKLMLHSPVFRGLHDNMIPPHLYESASIAVQSALAILGLLVTDSDWHSILIGMPCFGHAMLAFACTFLTKVSSKFSNSATANMMSPFEQVADGHPAAPAILEPARLASLIVLLVQLFRSTPASRWHLVRLMADGLERLASANASLSSSSSSVSSHQQQTPRPTANRTLSGGILRQPPPAGASFGALLTPAASVSSTSLASGPTSHPGWGSGPLGRESMGNMAMDPSSLLDFASYGHSLSPIMNTMSDQQGYGQNGSMSYTVQEPL